MHCPQPVKCLTRCLPALGGMSKKGHRRVCCHCTGLYELIVTTSNT